MIRTALSWSLLAGLSILTASAFAEPEPKRLPGPDTAAKKPAYAVPVKPSVQAALDLAGEWKMLLPAGWEKDVTIEPLHEGRFYLTANAMRGTYEIAGDRLRFLGQERLDVAAADAAADAADANKEIDAYEFRVYSSFLLTLVEQPKNRPGDYLGATLFRSNGLPPSKPGKPVRPIGAGRPNPDAPRPVRHGDLSTLVVVVEPSEEVWVDDSGNIAMRLTIRNDSAVPISFVPPSPLLPGRGATLNAAVFETGGDAGAELKPSDMHRLSLMLDEGKSGETDETPRLTLDPEESRTYLAFLEWSEIGRGLPVDGDGRCTIRVSLSFVADGKSQFVLSPAGRVVTLKPVPPEPVDKR